MALAMRLDKYLAHMGFGTRSEVKDIIKKGYVNIDGETIKKADYKVDANTIVYVDDEPVSYIEYEYYILNKPAGYISATEDRQYPTVMELVPSIRSDLAPVGRLDLDTEGLLLITNDGQLTHYLLSPKHHVPKKYYVEVDSSLPKDAKEQFSKPMKFEEFTSQPAQYENIDEHSAYLTIHEGKFHQVKRMFEKIGCTVTYLKRIEFGNLSLGDLQIGEYRPCTQEELNILKKLPTKSAV